MMMSGWMMYICTIWNTNMTKINNNIDTWNVCQRYIKSKYWFYCFVNDSRYQLSMIIVIINMKYFISEQARMIFLLFLLSLDFQLNMNWLSDCRLQLSVTIQVWSLNNVVYNFVKRKEIAEKRRDCHDSTRLWIYWF